MTWRTLLEYVGALVLAVAIGAVIEYSNLYWLAIVIGTLGIAYLLWAGPRILLASVLASIGLFVIARLLEDRFSQAPLMAGLLSIAVFLAVYLSARQ